LPRVTGWNQVSNLQRSHFADAQSQPVHQTKHQPITWVLDAGPELFHICVADITGQRFSLFHTLLAPDNGIGPCVIVCLIGQELEEMVQAGQATVDGGRSTTTSELLLHKVSYIRLGDLPRWLVRESGKDVQVVDIILGSAAVWVAAIQIAFELSDSLVHCCLLVSTCYTPNRQNCI
jgi:hypothetical protein